MTTSNSSSRSSRRHGRLESAVRAELGRRRSERALELYRPYPRQAEFHQAGAAHRERLFMAGNQLGKTLSGGMEAAIHATGLYPDWWRGRRFERATIGWAAGITGESTRDTVQRILLGRPGRHGTGAVPKASLAAVTAARGVPDLAGLIHVAHVAGGISLIGLRSYEKGREKWQGETLDWVWFDEEPPVDVYTEGLTRTNATGGLVWMTFTPLLGLSEVVRRFLHEPSPERHVTTMTIDDVGHYSEAQKARILASYPPHEREARARGVPVLGSGRIFPVAEEAITTPPISLPGHWPRLGALDFGWDHPFAAVELAWDRDSDTVYVARAFRQREATPLLHAAVLRDWGAWLPWAWPQDGLQHSKDSGEQLASQYRRQGLAMLSVHAQYEDGTAGVEAGLMDLLTRMQSGRFKVFSNLAEWLEEFRLYHRKEGRVVKEADDLMSATRYGVMMLRCALCPPLPRWMRPPPEPEYDPLHEFD